VTDISTNGLALIKRFEGCRLAAYQDSVGVWTIGYGHTHGVKSGMTITQEQADNYLRADANTAGADVSRLVKVDINQNQFDALTSFVFNLGAGALAGSTLLKKLNAHDVAGAGNEFLRWTHAGGEELPGLVKRRTAERALFLEGF
jgi:lysozyme